MAQTRVPSEEPYKFVVIKFFNKLVGHDADSTALWTGKLKDRIIAKFPNALSQEELDGDYDLSEGINLVSLFQRLQQLTAIKLAPKSIAQLKQYPETFRFVYPDVRNIGCRVCPCYCNQVDQRHERYCTRGRHIPVCAS